MLQLELIPVKIKLTVRLGWKDYCLPEIGLIGIISIKYLYVLPEIRRRWVYHLRLQDLL
jgi:hypothetical protein